MTERQRPGFKAVLWVYPVRADDPAQAEMPTDRAGDLPDWLTGALSDDLRVEPLSHQGGTANTVLDVESASKPILLLFSDDSTLFFCLRMRAELLRAAPERTVEMVWYVGETALSYRQMAQLLPEGPDRMVEANQLAALAQSPDLGAIITSRVYAALGNAIKPVRFRLGGNRPCIISFLGGLDFFPENGFVRRRNCDAVYLFPSSGIQDYKVAATAWDDSWQDVGFGHPSFLRPEGPPADLAQRRDIYFFTQALSPSTRRGRMHMLRAMAAIARANPDRTVWIKLRHLPHENQNHLHLERYDYPGLMAAMPDLPENLKLTACLMDEALETAALGITCTSTAAIDMVRAGIPSMVYLDYVDNYRDPLVEPMRGLFQDSGLIASLDDMLHLRSHAPNPDWVEQMLCPRDLGERVFDTIRRFEERPFQLTGKSRALI